MINRKKATKLKTHASITGSNVLSQVGRGTVLIHTANMNYILNIWLQYILY